MAPALKRLKHRADFLRVAALRRKWITPGLILQAAPADRVPDTGPGPVAGTAADTVRVGFTVSRRVGGAVERNRARRRLKAAADAVLGASARPGTDYVLIGRRETLRRPFALLVADLEHALRSVDARRGDAAHADGTARRPAARRIGRHAPETHSPC